MNSKTWTRIIALTSFAALALTTQLAAQETAELHRHHQYHHYKIVDPGTLGGPNSYNESIPPETIINVRGAAALAVDTSIPDPFAPNCFNSDCFVSYAVVWQRGVLTSLGALVPGYSSFPTAINARGEVAGSSENGQIDPLTAYPETAAVLWKNGVINLGSLGGNQAVSNGINDRGQVVGAALNAISDPFATVHNMSDLWHIRSEFRLCPSRNADARLSLDRSGRYAGLGRLGRTRQLGQLRE